MKHWPKSKFLPAFAVTMGIVGMVLRGLLYALCLDEKQLLPANHPLELLLWAITAVALIVIAVSVWKLEDSDWQGNPFAAAMGHVMFGAGILLTVLLRQPLMSGMLGKAWKLLGLLSGPCLAAAGVARWKGKQPFFALHMIPCLFLVAHIINHYQTWSGNPQLQDYFFPLMGTVALTLFAYYTAALDADCGRKKLRLGMGLAALCLCLITLSQGEFLLLYGSGLVWVAGDLCSLPLKPREKEGEIADDPS